MGFKWKSWVIRKRQVVFLELKEMRQSQNRGTEELTNMFKKQWARSRVESPRVFFHGFHNLETWTGTAVSTDLEVMWRVNTLLHKSSTDQARQSSWFTHTFPTSINHSAIHSRPAAVSACSFLFTFTPNPSTHPFTALWNTGSHHLLFIIDTSVQAIPLLVLTRTIIFELAPSFV